MQYCSKIKLPNTTTGWTSPVEEALVIQLKSSRTDSNGPCAQIIFSAAVQKVKNKLSVWTACERAAAVIRCIWNINAILNIKL